MGTDLYIAEYVMRRCAEHLAGHAYLVIVAPSVPYVNALFSLPYPGSVSIRRKVVEEYLFDLLASDSRREAHAGIYETAPMLYIQEHLMRKQLLKELPPSRSSSPR